MQIQILSVFSLSLPISISIDCSVYIYIGDAHSNPLHAQISKAIEPGLPHPGRVLYWTREGPAPLPPATFLIKAKTPITTLRLPTGLSSFEKIGAGIPNL